MQYKAVSPTGQTITTVTAHTKAEGKSKLEKDSLLLFKMYLKEWKIITNY